MTRPRIAPIPPPGLALPALAGVASGLALVAVAWAVSRTVMDRLHDYLTGQHP